MGIGNTTTSSLVLMALTGISVEQATGRGGGLTDAAFAHKKEVIQIGLTKHKPDPKDPVDVLSKVGGFDLAAMCGVFLGAARYRLPVVIDGFISIVAALCAARLCPGVRPYLIPSHHTAEPAGVLLEQALDVHPVLDAHMALGEGTGAVCLFPLLDLAASLYCHGSTFDESGIEAYVPQV
ncbi:MAG TPA: nicotinate-nucleotide--dimethylbenzimidazole phosphoribosyltransferase, partial [Clostridiales bacterium]|nr:nicotinate-nucleotide--dimethylbenzimidazole phosphoribosyltransferase [Clostridiales bacterium]